MFVEEHYPPAAGDEKQETQDLAVEFCFALDSVVQFVGAAAEFIGTAGKNRTAEVVKRLAKQSSATCVGPSRRRSTSG